MAEQSNLQTDMQNYINSMFDNNDDEDDTNAAFGIPSINDSLNIKNPLDVKPLATDNVFDYAIDKSQQLVGKGIQSFGDITGSETLQDFGESVATEQQRQIEEGAETLERRAQDEMIARQLQSAMSAPMVDPRTNVLTTPAVYPEGMDPSKIKYAPPKVSETPIITTPKVPNTTYQDVANRLTPGDGKKYVNGVLLDDSGNPVNSLYQQTANLFTPFDGKEYKNGVLIDSETRKPITQTAQAATVVQPERTEVWKDKLTGSALRAAQDAEKAGYTGSTVNDFAIGVISDGKTKGVLADAEGKVVRDANNRTVYVDAEGNQYVKTDIFGMSTETPTGTVATQKEDSGQSKQVDPVVKVSPPPAKKEDKSGEREANRAANKAAAKAEKTQQNAGRTESVEQKIKRGGGFNKGGLASKPKTKKTKTTNKRGLAARK